MQGVLLNVLLQVIDALILLHFYLMLTYSKHGQLYLHLVEQIQLWILIFGINYLVAVDLEHYLQELNLKDIVLLSSILW